MRRNSGRNDFFFFQFVLQAISRNIVYDLIGLSGSIKITTTWILGIWRICDPLEDWLLLTLVTMSKVFVGNLDARVSERDLEDEFLVYGVIRSVWVARRPPGYAFVEFDDRRDALDAIHGIDGNGKDVIAVIQGKNGWRVELSHNSKGSIGGRGGVGGRSRGGGGECYECGEPGHFARECRLRIGSRGLGSGRRRSPSPRYRRSPSYGYSPRGRRSLRRHSLSPYPRGRSYSRSPAYRRDSPYSRSPAYRRYSPYANGYRRRSRS